MTLPDWRPAMLIWRARTARHDERSCTSRARKLASSPFVPATCSTGPHPSQPLQHEASDVPALHTSRMSSSSHNATPTPSPADICRPLGPSSVTRPAALTNDSAGGALLDPSIESPMPREAPSDWSGRHEGMALTEEAFGAGTERNTEAPLWLTRTSPGSAGGTATPSGTGRVRWERMRMTGRHHSNSVSSLYMSSGCASGRSSASITSEPGTPHTRSLNAAGGFPASTVPLTECTMSPFLIWPLVSAGPPGTTALIAYSPIGPCCTAKPMPAERNCPSSPSPEAYRLALDAVDLLSDEFTPDL
eukprot:3446655-Rhodomonas_salina.2